MQDYDLDIQENRKDRALLLVGIQILWVSMDTVQRDIMYASIAISTRSAYCAPMHPQRISG